MLRALMIILVVIGLVFVAWSLLVMTGGRDWLVATMTTEEKVAAAPAEIAAPPQVNETKPAEEAEPAPAPAAATPAEDVKPADTANAPGESPDATQEEKPAAESSGATAEPNGNPTETAKSAEKGSLASPYVDNYESVADEGHKKFMAAGCNGCHGGTGGGGMGPPLSNPVWVYGNDGDTLFRLIALGSDGLQAQGYTRKGSENVVGPMPPQGTIVKSNDDLWKIIAWIWSINPPGKSASAVQ